MGATSAEVKVANLQGQIDGMERGRAQAMQSNFFNQSSNFMSNFCGSFMGGCAANMTDMFRFGGLRPFGW